MEYLSTLSFNTVFDLLGTFAFAVSGIRLASSKQFDLFGAYVIGLITAIGGGTTRDMLLGVSPFWMQEPSYLIVTGVALLATAIFKTKLFSWGRTLFLFDAIGLGLFTSAKVESPTSNRMANKLGNIAGLSLVLVSVVAPVVSSAEDTNTESERQPEAIPANGRWKFYLGVATPCVLGLVISNILTSTCTLDKPSRV